jgi:alkanesulfonate monooxygenase SsuD/methylene tetrahydromethanopterin reductase-like flavin-dependent oxidoreductase (luciferase family)
MTVPPADHERAPFASRSVSLRLYPHAIAPTARLAELEHQAALAADVGFDGVLLSERHGGAWGQIPNPLQAASWLLAAMAQGWVAPCPLLLPFRRPAVVAEEIAWLDARFPGRIGAGFGSGGNQPDFELVGVPFEERAARFERNLRAVVAILHGREPTPHAGDPAIEQARRRGIPLLSAAMSKTAVRRAAELGVGIIGSSLLSATRTRELLQAFRAAGGTGPHVLICRVWLGEPPLELMERQFQEYRHASDGPAAGASARDGLIAGTDGREIAARLLDAVRSAEADALNVRVHIAGLAPEAAREQIERVGREVVPHVRAAWSEAGASTAGA